MSSLTTDSDRDVAAAARTVNDEFKRQAVRMGGGGAGMWDSSGIGGSADFEAEDKRREEEEVDISFSGDDLDRCALRPLGFVWGKEMGLGILRGFDGMDLGTSPYPHMDVFPALPNVQLRITTGGGNSLL